MDFSRYVSLMYPEALVLGLALAYVYWKHLRHKNFWRIATLLLAIILLGYPLIIHSSKSFDLYLLIDRSRSISDEGRSKQKELVDLVGRKLQEGDRLGIVSFNEKAYIEQAPDSEAAIQSFSIPFSQDASDLAEGLQTILSLDKPNRPAKMCILSDGEYTGANPLREAYIARQRKIPIYYRNLKRLKVFNLTVKDIEMPDKILSNEPFQTTFNVVSTQETTGRYRIYRNNRLLGSEGTNGWRAYNFEQGENRIPLYDLVDHPGIHNYKIEVETIPAERENLKKDNIAERYVKVVGERPILLVNNTGQPDNISNILQAGGIQTHIINISNYRMTLERLEGYKGVILNNVPILNLTLRQIEAVKNFVLQEGGGLLVCGGNRSFASGGFYKSALDSLLPVSLEDRQQSKKVSTAFSIVLDRSGSMQRQTPSGHRKIELANNAAVECVALMTPMDSLSVIAVDSLAHIIITQTSVVDKNAFSRDILSIESMGGGIFVYTGLVAAGSELIKAPQINKHILLFSDASDSEEPGEYEDLLEDYIEAGITVSVVGLGTERDKDAEFLKDIAKRGEGNVYFTQDAAQLVQIFTADTISYVRKSFIEEPAPMAVQASAYSISPDQQWADFTCGGYNLLFPRQEAEVAIKTADEDSAPILAFCQRELGRVAALALDPNGAFSSNANYGDILLSVSRWIMGSQVDDNLQIKVDYEGNSARVHLEVSQEERETMGQAQMTVFTPGGATISRPMRWDSHDRLVSSVKLDESGCYRGVVQIGEETYKIGPMSIPVSPEFLYNRGIAGDAGSSENFGKQVMAQMATITGGKEILDVRELFERNERINIISPVLWVFLLAYLLFLLLDIAEARFAMLPYIQRKWISISNRLRNVKIRKPKQVRVKDQSTKPLKKYQPTAEIPAEATSAEAKAEEKPQVKSQPKEKVQEKPAMDYLSKSKERAKRSLDRG
ncbi:VWA domain-containing protein [bacterium]|nr:VWA domain-containing protein [bacterium]